jgi:hypothetical protein
MKLQHFQIGVPFTLISHVIAVTSSVSVPENVNMGPYGKTTLVPLFAAGIV